MLKKTLEDIEDNIVYV